MAPLMKSGQRVKITSGRNLTRDVKVGDIVLAHMGGRKWYLHLVTAIDGSPPPPGEEDQQFEPRYQISNNHGHVNGWTRSIWGLVTEIG